MDQNAYKLLFQTDFGEGRLFKNQGELASELINNQNSSFYIEKNDPSYSKKLGNLKVYISQLFSENTKRNISNEFKRSLDAVITSKFFQSSNKKEEVLRLIIEDLELRNSTPYHSHTKEKDTNSEISEFQSRISNADYLAVFSTREFNFKTSISFSDLLIDGLINSLKEGGQNKWYRFNFPTTQTCFLFWMGLRKEIIKYLKRNSIFLDLAISHLYSNKIISFNSKEELSNYDTIENRIASEILKYLSKNRIVIVFHQISPVYLFPFIAINPNDRNTKTVYAILQSDLGIDNFHMLTKDELFYWNYFVWDNLRINQSGKEIEYSEAFQ